MPILEEEDKKELLNSAENKTHGGWFLFIFGLLFLIYIFYGVFINDTALVDEPVIIFFSGVILMAFGSTLIFLGDREKMNLYELITFQETVLKNQDSTGIHEKLNLDSSLNIQEKIDEKPTNNIEEITQSSEKISQTQTTLSSENFLDDDKKIESEKISKGVQIKPDE